MKDIRPITATDNCRRDVARDLLAHLLRLDQQTKANEAQIREALAASQTTLTSLPGLGTALAARILGHIGDIDRFPTEHHFASYVGATPLDASNGKNIRYLADHWRGSAHPRTAIPAGQEQAYCWTPQSIAPRSLTSRRRTRRGGDRFGHSRCSADDGGGQPGTPGQ